MKYSFLLAAAMFAAVPAASYAATVSSDNVSGDPFTGTATVSVDNGAYWQATYDNGEAGGTLHFSLFNSSASPTPFTLLASTINQIPGAAYFTGGVSIVAGDGQTYSVAQGALGGNLFHFTIAPGSSQTFDVSYGSVVASGASGPQIQLTAIAPVPIPATGLLLVGALGGLGLMRRRRKSAA